MDPKLFVLETNFSRKSLVMNGSCKRANGEPATVYINPLLNLPTHVLLNILLYLSHKELISLSKLSTQTNRFVNDPVNGVWSHLLVTNRDDKHFFTLASIMKCGKPLLECINELVLDQGTCKSFKDGLAFSLAVCRLQCNT